MSNPSEIEKQLRQAIEKFIVNASKSRSKALFYQFEREIFFVAVHITKGNQTKAAKLLGVSRGTLRNKLYQYFGVTNYKELPEYAPLFAIKHAYAFSPRLHSTHQGNTDNGIS